MVEAGTPTDNLAAPQATEDILARLKPVMLLIAVTLQSAGEKCNCGPCRMLQQHAPDLVPLILRMASPEGDK